MKKKEIEKLMIKWNFEQETQDFDDEVVRFQNYLDEQLLPDLESLAENTKDMLNQLNCKHEWLEGAGIKIKDFKKLIKTFELKYKNLIEDFNKLDDEKHSLEYEQYLKLKEKFEYTKSRL